MHQIVYEPNARICGWDCKPVLHHPRTVCIPFAVNQNLLVFCMNTKRTGCAGCPFHAPGVLCSPQVCVKLINHAPNTSCIRTAQCISGALVYTRFCVHVLWPEKLKEIIFKIPMKKNWRMIPMLRNVMITKKMLIPRELPIYK